MHIMSLRQKLGSEGSAIRTVRGENAGMSIEKKGENPCHRKPEGS